MLVISCSRIAGVAIPLASCLLFAMLSFGIWSFSNEDHCFSVEYPDTKQYPNDPTASDPEHFVGLRVEDVTLRFASVFWFGFIIELLIFGFVLLGIACGSRITFFATLLGYASLGWFIWLLFARYDHYGKVCSGDYLGDRTETT